VALSLVLLLGAGLFLRSVQRLYSIDPGIDFERLLAVSVDLESAGFQGASRRDLEERAIARLRRVPGVESVTTAWPTPFSGSASARGFDLPEEHDATFDEGPYFHWVGPDYFRTMGLRIVRGRPILAEDDAGARPVAVINEPLARAFGSDGGVGRCVAIGAQVGEGGCTEIVGVAANARYRYEQDKEIPQVFLPGAQHEVFRQPTFLVRARDPMVDLLPAARATVQRLASNLPYVEAQPLTEVIGPRLLSYRLGAVLFTVFGVLALALAAVGLYGVLAYAVARRTRELGVRRSLGAQQLDLIRMVLAQGMRPVLSGLLIGVLLGVGGTRLIRARLYEVSPHDPTTFLVAVAALVLVALLAIWLPARRAARVDPMVALRSE
jgi:predicted permease